MQELIKITNQKIGAETVNSVNARELYETLEIKKEFATWIRNQIKSLNLDENIDYITFSKKVKAGKGTAIRKEYIITTDTAKHIAMASRTAKGKEVRNYFIAIEKEYIKNLEMSKQEIAPYIYQLERENIELKRSMNRLLLTGSADEELFQLKVKHRAIFPVIIEFFKRVEKKAKLEDATSYLTDIKNLLEREAKKINSSIMLGDMTMIPANILEREEKEHFNNMIII